MPNFENAFNTVCELVKDFKENENIYLSYKYNESQARKDFIDKFFIALGWDVNHTVQKNPHKQEVKVEQTLDNQSRPDYTFYLDPNFKEPKFFVEAKKPSRDLFNSDYYFQAINYARSANTPVTVLTDFEEFHILDSRYKPNINTVLKDQNHLVFKYNDYSDREKFAVIYYLFSRYDVANNSIKDYADKLTAGDKKRKKSGYTKGELLSIDEEFLLYLDNIRVRLAKAFKKADASLSSEELTEATQRTIDRLVFIRFLEDKNIEPEDIVSKLGTSNKSWYDFINICRKLDAKYNGIVFKEHFIDNQNFGGPELSEFKNVCFEFSRKNSQSFNYNLIPIHILGSIYERFLGKVVNATAQRVKVEEKPEVRKAGGVYYTPKYIVDYIVENTVGKILRNENSSCRSGILPDDSLKDCPTEKIGKTPKEISKLRFADIACGSGSFLIGVFETLLDYHNNYYWNNQEEAKKDGCIFKDGVPVLSIKQKQNILLNNIYGVDIDPQAVEVTQLSLALKMLEDESLATANDMQVLFHEQILPNLSKNIICGNSLIGTDIIYEDSSEAGLFERKRRITVEEERKLNPMDFDNRFFEIMVKGGFDAIVGNPPYVRVDILSSSTKKYILDNFNSAKGKYDLYYLFLERAYILINKSGKLSYIIPNRFTTSDSGYELRKLLINNSNEVFINSVSKIRVFKNAATYPCILVITNNNSNNRTLNIKETINIDELNNLDNLINIREKSLNKLPNLIIPLNSDELIINLYFKLLKSTIYSEEIMLIQEGLRIPKEIEKEVGDFHILKQYQFTRYSQIATGSFVIEKDLQKYINPSSNRFINCLKPKLIFAEDALKIEAIFDLSKSICQGGVYFATNIDKCDVDLKYLLGLYNSKLLTTLYKGLFSGMHMGGGYLRFRTSFLNKLPIKQINVNIESEKQSHDKIVSLVNEMLEAKKQLQTVKTDRDKTYYGNKCTDLDRAIDSEVYNLYGLTEEEIKIVEEKL